MNGRPLEPQHGFPLRLLVPGWYGMASVKWLTRIEVVAEPFAGYQQSVAYRYKDGLDDPGVPVRRIRPRALLLPPGFPDFLTRQRILPEGPSVVEGRAWSGNGPVVRVEFGVDGTWREAVLDPLLGEYAWRSGQRHTVELAPAIADLLTRCALTINDVNALGVALGPGSFTSLRVGLALVKGLALSRHIPLIGIPTLDILAHAQPASKLPLAVAIQAGRGRYALGWYKVSRKQWQAQDDARVVTLEALMAEIESPSVVCGEFTAEVGEDDPRPDENDGRAHADDGETPRQERPKSASRKKTTGLHGIQATRCP
jgi:tRNA threonylcarbamoyl adenosine modification protein YeaZ